MPRREPGWPPGLLGTAVFDVPRLHCLCTSHPLSGVHKDFYRTHACPPLGFPQSSVYTVTSELRLWFSDSSVVHGSEQAGALEPR